MKFSKSGLVLFLLVSTLLQLAFQNCSQLSNPIAFDKAGESKASNSSDGSGAQPYDGKIYVLLGATLCPDKTSIQSRVILKSQIAGEIVRQNCTDLKTPISLAASDFSLDPIDPNKIIVQNQSFSAENLIQLSGLNGVFGYGYYITQDFGTPADSLQNLTLSVLRVFENGVELGPAHSYNTDIEKFGGGRFVHWQSSTAIHQAIELSTSDNSDPRTNGRKYTYIIGN